ncbi:HAMP domain-containing histidine kinase [Candidatus Obscuribacterales bacterium]|nr:HAMP domain-containing histidine kinase [Candidatus Obscuribacterales bacterium]
MAMITHDLRPDDHIEHTDFYTRGVFSTTDEKGKKFLQSACRNADRMTALINDLLDIEKIEAGMMELAIDTIPLQECFVAVAETSALVAKEQDIELVFVDTDYLVDCDLDRIIRVLQNLVSNAIKFSPEGSKVRVSAKQVGNFVEVSVADQGPGIPPDMVSVVFDRYRQIGTSKTESSTGSGLDWHASLSSAYMEDRYRSQHRVTEEANFVSQSHWQVIECTNGKCRYCHLCISNKLWFT